MIVDRVSRAMSGVFSANGTAYSGRIVVRDRGESETPADMYQALRAYYYNNRLYQDLAEVLKASNIYKEAQSGLRNPTHSAVEFYPATLWPGSLRSAIGIETVTSQNETRADLLKQQIQQVWQWSNWGTQKQAFARNLPMLGDQFLKVATRSEAEQIQRVFFHSIEPDYVSDFTTDERGFLTYIRVDIPRMRREGDDVERYIHTEVWDKQRGTYRLWEHDGTHTDLEQLGTALRDEDIEALTGNDFIPFVHAKFIDDGRKRGTALIVPALDKIDEANRMVTRLHQLLFNYGAPDYQIVSGNTDPDGFPVPAPQDSDAGGIVNVGDSEFWRPPSTWRVEDILPNVNFQAHLEAVNAAMDDLRRTDLPELEFGRVADGTELSGIAIRLKMTAAIARAEEVRGNAESALIQANQMALSIAQEANISGFEASRIGTFDAGDFEHWFTDRPVVPLSEAEEAEIRFKNAQAAEKMLNAGFSERTLQRDVFGLTEAQIEQNESELPADAFAGRLLDQTLNRGG